MIVIHATLENWWFVSQSNVFVQGTAHSLQSLRYMEPEKYGFQDTYIVFKGSSRQHRWAMILVPFAEEKTPKHRWIRYIFTLPETNSKFAPENGWVGIRNSFLLGQKAFFFRGKLTVSFFGSVLLLESCLKHISIGC